MGSDGRQRARRAPPSVPTEPVSAATEQAVRARVDCSLPLNTSQGCMQSYLCPMFIRRALGRLENHWWDC